MFKNGVGFEVAIFCLSMVAFRFQHHSTVCTAIPIWDRFPAQVIQNQIFGSGIYFQSFVEIFLLSQGARKTQQAIYLMNDSGIDRLSGQPRADKKEQDQGWYSRHFFSIDHDRC
ncbi:MAG: hypothetical protein IPJ06_18225 [Saprospiraceae bacterium]|nr:hypothetical protein [Saprospiraceae bacterium]